MAGEIVSVNDKALKKLANSLLKQAVESEKDIYLNVQQAAHSIRENLRRGAPYDSGRYSHSWRVKDNNKKIAHFSIYNTKDYGVYIEGGVVPGKEPWPQPGPKTVQATRQGSVRIWSRSAVGGTVYPYITDAFASRMTRSFIKIIVGNLKRA